jgi:hypothetical protein
LPPRYPELKGFELMEMGKWAAFVPEETTIQEVAQTLGMGKTSEWVKELWEYEMCALNGDCSSILIRASIIKKQK